MRRIILMVWIAALAGTCWAQPLMMSKERYRANLEDRRIYSRFNSPHRAFT